MASLLIVCCCTGAAVVSPIEATHANTVEDNTVIGCIAAAVVALGLVARTVVTQSHEYC